MAKIMATKHRVIKIFGVKVCDVWDDFIERQIIDDDITITEYNFDEKEDKNNN